MWQIETDDDDTIELSVSPDGTALITRIESPLTEEQTRRLGFAAKLAPDHYRFCFDYAVDSNSLDDLFEPLENDQLAVAVVDDVACLFEQSDLFDARRPGAVIEMFEECTPGLAQAVRDVWPAVEALDVQQGLEVKRRLALEYARWMEARPKGEGE